MKKSIVRVVGIVAVVLVGLLPAFQLSADGPQRWYFPVIRLQRDTEVIKALYMGDSKTVGIGDELSLGGYPARINEPAPVFIEVQKRIGVGGSTVRSVLPDMPSYLATVAGTPDVVLMDWGANDVTEPMVEATWKENYLAIVDAVYARWPKARIYIAMPWKHTFDAETATLKKWIIDIVAARPTFCALGIDEAPLFASSWETLMPDGVHPNADGYTLMAQAWRNLILTE